MSPAQAATDLARKFLWLTASRGTLIAQGTPAVRAIDITSAHHALALRATRAQFVITTRAEVEPGLCGIPALRAGSLPRLSEDEVEKNSQAIGNKNGHQRPKDRAHPAALRVAVDVADEYQVTPCGNAGQQAKQWPSPCRRTVRVTSNSNIEEPLRGNEYDPRQHPCPRRNDPDFRPQSSLSVVSYQHSFVRFLVIGGARRRSLSVYPGPTTTRPPRVPERKRKIRNPLAKPEARRPPTRQSMQRAATKGGW